MMNKYDQQAALISAKKEGREEGREENEAKNQEKLKTLFSLLESGVSLAEVKKRIGVE